LSVNLSEDQLVKVWQRQLLDRTKLVTEDGRLLEIVYPGRSNDDPGPDFRDAVICLDSLACGDIEVHVRSSDWKAHQHHRDSVYNRVILHVVARHNTRTSTTRQDGQEVPVLTLSDCLPREDCLDEQGLPEYNMSCARVTARLGVPAVTEFLEQAGEARFLGKANGFRTSLFEVGGEQLLYEGIMGALGYSRNKLPFLRLAHRLPLEALESLTRGEMSDEECLVHLQARLFGTAGLLSLLRCDSSMSREWVSRLESTWLASGISQSMSLDDWKLFKVRPNNSPVRRLAAMGYILVRCRKSGLFEGVAKAVKEIPSGDYRRLESIFVVGGNREGQSHYSLNHCGTLLGGERAGDIIINVLLPFVFAWSQSTGQVELNEKSFALYRDYPGSGGNCVERHMMAQLGLNSRLVNSARRKQGLMHIYDTLCIRGRCNACQLSQLETGDHVHIQAVCPSRLEMKIAAGGNHCGIIGT